MQKTIWKLLNALSFILVAMAGAGSIHKAQRYAPDSLIYQVALLVLCGTYLFNYWSIQQPSSKKLASISDIVNIAAGALFLVGSADKPSGGDAGLVLILVILLPLAGTVLYLHRKLPASKE